MNRFFYSAILFSTIFLVASCSKDDEETTIDYEYHAHIHTSNTDHIHLGDTIVIDVEFESHTGEAIHHVNVRIYDKSDNMEIYNKPDAAHIHETDGAFEFHDDFVLSNANGVTANSTWILEAKVWGPEDGEGEEMERVEFSVLP